MQTYWGQEYWWPGQARIGTRWINTLGDRIVGTIADHLLGAIGLPGRAPNIAQNKISNKSESENWSPVLTLTRSNQLINNQ